MVGGKLSTTSSTQILPRRRWLRDPDPAVEGTMKTQRLPQTNSIQELAQFWDTHDLTDFEDGLEEVTEPVFEPVL